jgi:apolipoprotein N-acyltransferase
MNKIIALIFVLFAAVQYNDPDWYLWIPIYGLVALIYFVEVPKILLQLLFLGYTCYAASYVPSFITWIQNDMPSITGSMKASNPEVEFMREFFGLLIVLVAAAYRLYTSSKK